MRRVDRPVKSKAVRPAGGRAGSPPAATRAVSRQHAGAALLSAARCYSLRLGAIPRPPVNLHLAHLLPLGEQPQALAPFAVVEDADGPVHGASLHFDNRLLPQRLLGAHELIVGVEVHIQRLPTLGEQVLPSG